ncbi:hypothetical protein [Agrococcus sp. DT81.2]|uniref:hypothetical protein n=1 Tax=Agrococcus sp. DT81.2 TaxID=3393414 RepID=UPI003CE4A358
MDILDAYARARDLGGDVAEAEHKGEPLPIPRAPSADELWRAVMGDVSRADYPTNTLRQIRAEFERGYSMYW